MKRCIREEDCRAYSHAAFTIHEYQVYDCNECGRRYTPIEQYENHLEKVYSDAYFFEGGAGYPDYLAESKLLMQQGFYYASKLEKHSKPGQILDVGCAAGFLLKAFKNKGWQCLGLEPNSTMARYGRDFLGLQIVEESLESYDTDSKFDLVSLIQVIGHFYNFHLAMNNIGRLLNPHGMVLVESWNMKSLIAKILGKKWHEYSPPSVVNWFSEDALISIFREYGYGLIDTGYPRKKIQMKHGISLVKSKLPSNPVSSGIFSLMEQTMGKITLPYPPMDLKWYLFVRL
jgi:SAM-dependent methyltransferase